MIATKNGTPFKTSSAKAAFPRLEARATDHASVLIAGSGITGLTAALLLQRAGKKVIVVDSSECGGGESAYSTAQMTEILDTRYYELIETFGEEKARLAAHATRSAMNWAEQFVAAASLRCGLQHVPAFLYTDNQDGVREIEREIAAARQCGLSVTPEPALHPAFRAAAALSFPNQLQMNPYAYVQGLARQFTSLGGIIYENSRVVEVVDGQPCTVKFENAAMITANDVICATHVPVCNLLYLHTKLAAYRTYVLGLQLRSDMPPLGEYFDTHDPYHYTREAMLPDGPILLVGGEDHKTGTIENTEQSYDRLLNFATRRFDVAAVRYRWSGQIIEPVDGLPYIGKNSASQHVYVATGYSGNGMTYGTLAGMMLTDAIMGRANPYAELFKATRINPVASAANFVAENLDAVYHAIGDYLSPADHQSLRELPLNGGGIVSVNGEKTAVFHASDGYHLFSAVCPHLKCCVHWNNSDKTFDCPCHGSRFDCEGQVVNGPAVTGLKPLTKKPAPVPV